MFGVSRKIDWKNVVFASKTNKNKTYKEGEGTPTDDAAAAAAAAAAKAASDAAAKKKTFDEEQVNKIVQERIKEYSEKLTKVKSQLEGVLTEKTTTEAERAALRQKLEEMNSTLMTREQAAAFEAKKLQEEAKTKEEQLAKERDAWKNKYTSQMIDSSIVKAAVDNKAYQPQQLVALLGSKAQLVEKIDDTGRPTGDFEVKIVWYDTDKDGKTVNMTLDPAATVKAMKQKTEFANLFLAEGGGTGFVPTRGNQSSGTLDPSKMDTADWIKGQARARYENSKR